MGHGEEKPHLGAVDPPASVLVSAVKRHVEPDLEPWGHAVGPFGHLVQRFVSNFGPRKCRCLHAIGREVGVQHQVQDARLRKTAVVDLDLIGLRNGQLRHRQHDDDGRNPAHVACLHVRINPEAQNESMISTTRGHRLGRVDSIGRIR